MRSPIAFIAAVLAALTCAGPALATTSPTVPLRTDGRIPIGFNEDYSLNRIWADSATATPWVAADADASAAAGATVSRTPLYWKGVQPTRGAWNWGTYDRIIGAYSGRGMRVIVNVSGTPDWAGVDDLTPFVKALAERYGTRLAGIEIYNEPNSSKYWGGPADPALYTQFLCAGYRGAVAANVRVPVAGGSLAPNMKSVNGDMRMDWFLNAMFQNGAASCMDVISFHPYPFSTDLTSATSMFQQEFAQIRKTRDYWAPSMRLWVSVRASASRRPASRRLCRRRRSRRSTTRSPRCPSGTSTWSSSTRSCSPPARSRTDWASSFRTRHGRRCLSQRPDIWRFRAGSRRVARHEPPQFRGGGGFCPTLCPANIVLTMAMSWGRTLEGVHERSRFSAPQTGSPDGLRVQRLRGIA